MKSFFIIHYYNFFVLIDKQFSRYYQLVLQTIIQSFPVLLIILFAPHTSCSQVKEEITPITEIHALRKDTVFKIQDRDFVDMMIKDSLLILIANKDSLYFHVFSKTTLNPIINFAKKGNAEFEFNYRPLFLKQHYENKNYFEVFDLFSIKKINIKNILDENNIAGEIKSDRQNEDLTFSREILRLDSNFFTGTSLNRSEGLFYIYDIKNRNKKWINFNPKLKINKKYYDSVYYGLIEVSPDSEKIVYCPRFFNRILFFNRDGELIKTLNFSKTKTPTIEKKYLGVSNEETIYSYQTYRTSNFIYVLRPLRSLDDLIGNVSPIKVQVLCLTWDGNISDVYEIDLTTMPTLFCIDEENKKILFHTPLDSYLSNDVISEISIYEFE